MPIRSFQYRLYPTRAQRVRLESVLESSRRFYNLLLDERKTAYETEGRSATKTEQLRRVKDFKKSNPFCREFVDDDGQRHGAMVHSHILQVAASDLDKAFQAFFRRVKSGSAPGYPRFKGRNRYRSIGLKEYGNGYRIDGRRLKITGVGRVAVRWHREIPDDAKIKTLRVVRKAGKWYATFACEVAPEPPLPKTGRDVGIDLGISHLYVTSDGEMVENPAFYRKAQRALRVAQRSVARKKKGGANRRKAVAVLQRKHERIVNARKDYGDKLIAGLVRDYDRIALEDLRVSNMVRNRSLAKSILDSSWNQLTTRLCAKAESAGRIVSLVNPAYTSRDCSACGHRKESMPLSLRRWACPECGSDHQRDHNAALNILARGHRVWASSATERSAQEAAGL